jgi:diketogulonate reductase-like aldo/keto reductase
MPLLEELLKRAKIAPAINQVEFSLACFDKELLRYCQSKGIATMGYTPFGGCWMATHFPAFVEWQKSSLIENPVVQAVSSELGCSPALLLLKWVVQQGVTTIPKVSVFSFQVFHFNP